MALKDLPPIEPDKPQPSEFGITIEQYNKSQESKWPLDARAGCGCYIGAIFLFMPLLSLIQGKGDEKMIPAVIVGVIILAIFIFLTNGNKGFSDKTLVGIEKYKNALKEYEPVYHEYLTLLRAYEKSQKDWWFRLSGRRFEQEFEQLLHNRGYKTDLTKATGDGGVDVRARKDGKKILIECKAWKDKVGVGIIRQLNGVRELDEDAWVVGLGGFTKGAIEFAKEKSIQLYEYKDIARWVEELQSEKFAEQIKEQRAIAKEKNQKKILAEEEWRKKRAKQEKEELKKEKERLEQEKQEKEEKEKIRLAQREKRKRALSVEQKIKKIIDDDESILEIFSTSPILFFLPWAIVAYLGSFKEGIFFDGWFWFRSVFIILSSVVLFEHVINRKWIPLLLVSAYTLLLGLNIFISKEAGTYANYYFNGGTYITVSFLMLLISLWVKGKDRVNSRAKRKVDRIISKIRAYNGCKLTEKEYRRCEFVDEFEIPFMSSRNSLSGWIGFLIGLGLISLFGGVCCSAVSLLACAPFFNLDVVAPVSFYIGAGTSFLCPFIMIVYVRLVKRRISDNDWIEFKTHRGGLEKDSDASKKENESNQDLLSDTKNTEVENSEVHEDQASIDRFVWFAAFIGIISSNLIAFSFFEITLEDQNKVNSGEPNWKNYLGATLIVGIIMFLFIKWTLSRIKKGNWFALAFMAIAISLIALAMNADKSFVNNKYIFFGTFIFESLLLLNAASVAFKVHRSKTLKNKAT